MSFDQPLFDPLTPDIPPASALILCGQREEGEPEELCEEEAIDWKVLIDIHGHRMIDYVMRALDGAPWINGPYWISGLETSLIGAGLRQSPKGKGPADAVLKAMSAEADDPIPYPVFVTTGDHPLLTPGMVMDFIKGAHEKKDADFVIGMARQAVVEVAYPNVRRTYAHFFDGSVSGCNMFYIRNPKGLKAVRFFREIEEYRKVPSRIAQAFGIDNMLLYSLLLLRLDDAFARMSKKIGAKIDVHLMMQSEACVDVDKPSDLALVREIMKTRI